LGTLTVRREFQVLRDLKDSMNAGWGSAKKSGRLARRRL
jgi:hypothetical protein